MALNRELTDQEIRTIETLLDPACPPVLPVELKIVATTLEEAGLLKRVNGRMTVTDETKKMIQNIRDLSKLKRF